MPDTLHETLREKSIHDLRTMAQAFGVNDVFSKDKNNIIQEIVLKHAPVAPAAVVMPPLPVSVNQALDDMADPDDVTAAMKPYAALGLRFQFIDSGTRWSMRFGERADEGTMSMPLKTVIDCARKLLA